MPNSLWSKAGARPLDLGRGSGDSRKLEYAMIVVLGAIIVGAIWAAVSSLVSDKTPRGPQARDMHLECAECQHQFTRSPEELNEASPEGMIFEEMGMAQLDCPKCKATKSCLPMVKCPKCGEFFLAESTKQQAAQMNMPPPRTPAEQRKPPEVPRDICPHCGQDRVEWYRQKYRKKK